MDIQRLSLFVEMSKTLTKGMPWKYEAIKSQRFVFWILTRGQGSSQYKEWWKGATNQRRDCNVTESRSTANKQQGQPRGRRWLHMRVWAASLHWEKKQRTQASALIVLGRAQKKPTITWHVIPNWNLKVREDTRKGHILKNGECRNSWNSESNSFRKNWGQN